MKPLKHVIRSIKQFKFFSVFVLLISCAGLIFIKDNILTLFVSSGWIYTWESEIPIHTTLPGDFGGLTVSPDAVDVSLKNGTYYHLSHGGTVNWSFDMQDYSIYPPAIDKDMIYISGFDGRLYALDKQTGKEQWRFNIPNYIKAGTEPRIAGTLVLFGGENGILYALNKQTGDVVWQFKTNPIDYSRIIPGESNPHFGRFVTDATTAYVNSAADNTLYALDISTGKPRWSLPAYGYTFLNPTVFPDSISIRNSEGTYLLLDKKDGSVLFKTPASEYRLTEDDKNIYVINSDNSIDAVDSASGVSIWKYQSDRSRPQSVQTADDSHVVILEYYDTKPAVTVLERSSGKKRWTSTIPFENIFFVKTDAQHVYVVGKNIQYALRLTTGSEEWRSGVTNAMGGVVIGQSGIYIISENTSDRQISYLTKNTGTIKWQFLWGNINTNYVRAAGDNLYFITKDSRSVVMLNKNSPYGQIELSDLQTKNSHPSAHGVFVNAVKSVWLKFSRLIYKQSYSLIIDAPKEPVSKNDVYEITLTLNDSMYQNKQKDVEVLGEFISPQGTKYQIKGFYFDKNTWKVRLVPDKAGTWNWSLHVQSSYSTENRNGSFTALDSKNTGFITISPNNPRMFTTDDGAVFFPIGIQDCVEDKNNDGDPLDQWFPGIADRPPKNPKIIPAYSMDTYLSVYENGGFNLWRWGAGNCSYKLWLQMSSRGNKYGLNEGLRTDILFQALRKHNYHIWMDLLSFTPPYTKTTATKDRMAILHDYVDYVVSRYAAYVDIWELGNEIYFDDQVLKDISSYIRSVDPYQHPVTTNWEMPEAKTIDINSLHWYDAECDSFCDKNLDKQLSKYSDLTKPTVFSESGNRDANWDYSSAERMRVRLWLAYMRNIPMIFWNTSAVYYTNSHGTSNIYLGPTERTYISVFNDIVRQVSENTNPVAVYPLTEDVKISGLGSKNLTLIYVYRRISDPEYKPALFTVTLPGNGLAKWVNPQTGDVISQNPVTAGSQTLTSPSFGTDLILIITYK